MEARNYQVIHASDGEAGLQAALAERPHLILIDLGLPDIDGQTLVTVMKQMPELQQTPLVVVTAWPEDTARAMVLAYGCDGFISKPINTRSFADQISQYLAKS